MGSAVARMSEGTYNVAGARGDRQAVSGSGMSRDKVSRDGRKIEPAKAKKGVRRKDVAEGMWN
jgi:hypothetical protein